MLVDFEFGRSDRIRTYDPYVPNVVLYQTEPHSEVPGAASVSSGFSDSGQRQHRPAQAGLL